ncbi:MAG: hypothetical protein Q8P13_03265 [bacterium]|nr:hypothetical protein [bacterium]
MKYTMTCNQGHEDEPFTASVEAENDDEAMGKMMEEVKPHLAEKHSDLAGKSDDELKEMIVGMWSKEEGGAAMGGDTTPEAGGETPAA